MTLVVQKFGGSSLADPRKIRRAAERVKATRDAGCDVVLVASAMGKTTDKLLELVDWLSPTPAPRELAMLLSTGEQISISLLAIALQAMDCPAVSYTADQIGLRTNDRYQNAGISDLNVNRLRDDLVQGRVPVIAGFQGTNEEGEITTLGRGGSDTTAAALAAALGADVCEILTDVAGVYTADPNLVPRARKLDEICYEEMFEMESTHGGVVHPRAVRFAMKYGVPIHVRHSAVDEAGTFIVAETTDMAANIVSGLALKPNIGRVTINAIPNVPGVVAELLNGVARLGVNVDDIFQQVHAEDLTSIAFTIDGEDLDQVRPLVKAICQEIGSGFSIDSALAKVSAVGVGMRSNAGVAAQLFEALAESRIEVLNIATSEIKVSVLVHQDVGELALNVIHEAFGLEKGAAVA